VEYRKGETEWRNKELGGGTLVPLPPETPTPASASSDMATLEWQGQVTASRDAVVVSGFSAADVSIKVSTEVSVQVVAKDRPFVSAVISGLRHGVDRTTCSDQ
jgi:hypothetical protein